MRTSKSVEQDWRVLGPLGPSLPFGSQVHVSSKHGFAANRLQNRDIGLLITWFCVKFRCASFSDSGLSCRCHRSIKNYENTHHGACNNSQGAQLGVLVDDIFELLLKLRTHRHRQNDLQAVPEPMGPLPHYQIGFFI